MKKSLINIALGITASAVMLSSVFLHQSCGQRQPNLVRLKVGESVVLTPIPVQNLTENLPEAPPKKLLLQFMSGGKEVTSDSNAEILFFANPQDEIPYYVLRADEFRTKHLTTGCASSDVSLLDNAADSDVLICDGSLDVNKAKLLKLKTPEGKIKVATNIMPVSLENDLFYGSVLFH
ncbi:MAG: hypothetical protein RLZZ488_1868 [Pseudomonadota bacterium]|jgi:hypothetical protein